MLIVTDHDRRCNFVVQHARLVIDTPNATKAVQDRKKIIKS